MRALRLDFPSRTLSMADHAEPPAPVKGQVLLRLLEGGVCGTDRGVAAFEFGAPPEGESILILGHEAVAIVEEESPGGGILKKGQVVVPMVRRNCRPLCSMCRCGRRDNCITGEYEERGIFGLHGYLCEWAVDDETDLVSVPASMTDLAVLVEPASVIEKAWELAIRLHPGEPRRVLVLGAGPIGILAAWRALTAGLEVTVLSREPETSPRARLLRSQGANYVNHWDGVQADIILEACGSAELAIASMQILGRLGVVILLGAKPAQVRLPSLDMIIGNHILAGSVNASRDHFERAAERLGRYPRRWLEPLLVRAPLHRASEMLFRPPDDAVKVVHRITE